MQCRASLRQVPARAPSNADVSRPRRRNVYVGGDTSTVLIIDHRTSIRSAVVCIWQSGQTLFVNKGPGREPTSEQRSEVLHSTGGGLGDAATASRRPPAVFCARRSADLSALTSGRDHPRILVSLSASPRSQRRPPDHRDRCSIIIENFGPGSLGLLRAARAAPPHPRGEPPHGRGRGSHRPSRSPRRGRRGGSTSIQTRLTGAASRRPLRVSGGRPLRVFSRRLLRVSGRRLLRVSVRRWLLPRAGSTFGPWPGIGGSRPPFIPLSTVRVVRAHGPFPDPLFLVIPRAIPTLAMIRASSMERTLVSEPVSCAPDGAK